MSDHVIVNHVITKFPEVECASGQGMTPLVHIDGLVQHSDSTYVRNVTSKVYDWRPGIDGKASKPAAWLLQSHEFRSVDRLLDILLRIGWMGF